MIFVFMLSIRLWTTIRYGVSHALAENLGLNNILKFYLPKENNKKVDTYAPKEK